MNFTNVNCQNCEGRGRPVFWNVTYAGFIFQRTFKVLKHAARVCYNRSRAKILKI